MGLAGALVNHTTFQILMGADQKSMVDVTATLPPMNLLKIHYVDPMSFEADTLDLIFVDIKDQIINNNKIKKGVWLKVTINQYNKDYPGSHTIKKLGSFMIDQIKQSGPPTQTTLMASSLPISSQIQFTLKNQTSFGTDLKSLNERVAKENGLTPVFNVDEHKLSKNPILDQVAQWNETDLQMLSRICKSHGLGLRVTDGKLIIFDEQDLEQKPPIYTIDFRIAGAGIGMTSWELTTQSQDIYSQSQLANFDEDTNQFTIGVAQAPEGSATGSKEVLNTYDSPYLTKASGGEDIAGAV